MMKEDEYADFRQPFFGAMGCTSAIVFTCFGAAYGTAKAGVGISSMGVLRPDLIVKSMSTCQPRRAAGALRLEQAAGGPMY